MKNSQIFGLRPVIEAIEAGRTIDKLFIQKGLSGTLFATLLKLVERHQLSHSFVPVEKLNRLTHGNHQGVVAQLSPVEFVPLEELVRSTIESSKVPLLLILDHLSDVRNVGAIIRTAECAGVRGIILPKQGSAAIGEDMVKTSAGAIFNIPLCKVDNLIDAIYYLQGSGIKVVGATEKAPTLLYDLSLTEPLAIVMGAEDVGISKGVLRVLDERAKLPLQGETASLNVSVACGAFLYEVVRQRIVISDN